MNNTEYIFIKTLSFTSDYDELLNLSLTIYDKYNKEKILEDIINKVDYIYDYALYHVKVINLFKTKFTFKTINEELNNIINDIEKRHEEYNKLVGIKEVVINDNLNYFITTNEEYVSFIKLDVKERLDMLDDKSISKYLSSFYQMLSVSPSRFSIHYLNKRLSFKQRLNELEEFERRFGKNKTICSALESDIRRYKKIEDTIKFEKMAFIQIKEKSFQDLATTMNQLLSKGIKVETSLLDSKLFNLVLNKLVYQYNYISPSTSQTYGYDKKDKNYFKILNIKKFGRNQEALYLQNIVNYRFPSSIESQLTLNIEKLSKEDSMQIASSNLTKVSENHKYDKKESSKIAQGRDYHQIKHFIEELETKDQEVITETEYKLILKSKDYKDLENITKQLNLNFKGKIEFIEIPFDLKYQLVSMMDIKKVDLKHQIQMSLEHLAYSFGHNFVSFYEENGIDICLNANTLVTTNPWNKTSDKPSSSGYICGTMGSGKSTFAKALIFHNAMIGNKNYVIDQDNEFTGLFQSMNGSIIYFGTKDKTYINPLKVEKTKFSNANFVKNHLVTVQNIVRILAGDSFGGDVEIVFNSIITKMYDEMIDEEFTFSDVIEYTKKFMLKEKKDNLSQYKSFEKSYYRIIKILENIVFQYPDLNKKTNVVLDNDNISFNITAIKEDEKYVSALMLLIFSFLSKKMSNNQLILKKDQSNKKFEEVFAKLEELGINKEDIDIEILNDYEKLKELYENNKQFILLFIDEFHRMTKIKEVLQFVVNSVREGRKYDAGMWFASQSFTDVFYTSDKDSNESKLWELLPYKFIFKQEARAVDKINEFIRLTRQQSNKIISAGKGQGICQIGSGIYPYEKRLSKEYLNIFDGGK